MTQKWVLLEGQTRPKREWDFKDQIWSQMERGPVEKEGRREEEEEEEKKRRSGDQAKVWNFGFLVWKLP